MRVAILLGLTALVAMVAAAPSPEAEPGVKYNLKKHWKHKHPHKKVHKHHHHRKNKHLKHAHGASFCGLPGTFCSGGKRDVGELLGYEEGYCGAPGNECNTVKRTAWAIADALEEARSVTDSPSFCGAPGTPCELAESAVDAIAAKAREAYGAVYEREAEAFAEAAPKDGLCGPSGTPCTGGRDAKPDPEATAYENDDLGVCDAEDTPCLAVRDAKHAHGAGFCGLPGTFCSGGKRDAAPEPKHAHGAGFCGLPGTFCSGGKRDAAPQPKHAHGAGFCGLPGTFCSGGKRDAAPEPKHAHGAGFCGLPGTFCSGGKRDAAPEPSASFCGLPGTPCVGGNEAKAMVDAIKKADPKWLKDECHMKGHACNTIYNIHKAFHQAKGEAKEYKKISDPMAKFAHCGEKGADKCGYLTYAHQYAAKHNKPAAAEEEKRCNGTDGLCTAAKRDLDELESTIDAAVAAIQAAA